jgi:hypothetical protein
MKYQNLQNAFHKIKTETVFFSLHLEYIQSSGTRTEVLFI